ncbi:hypothetical protein [Bacillus changyiensis]|uniref:hypothetical protein n=1 Tax=Bacillus changyiensis TaxID=3004103 RepID=UPI0022E2D12C|nr:hypothetical protein [Bacillus changyiensis]MDA1477226.1 hypothetical protein [Bacillus changyiensis]
MNKMSAFDEFASRVLNTYHMGEKEFWAAVMAPFLSDTNILTMWKHRKIGIKLLRIFDSLDNERKKFLTEYTLPVGFNISQWESLNKKDEYFRDAYPIYAFLVIWMEENGLAENLNSFDGLLRAVVYGIAGYGILDVQVDEDNFSPVELLTAQMLIAEYETEILRNFGVTEVNLNILHRIRTQFLKAEIKEKSLRGKGSPYEKDKPIECGFKAAHLLTPFMLSLEQLGKSSLIDAYFEVFFSFGAVIQIIDDFKDLVEDISIGHFSYVTLDSEVISLYKKGQKPREIAEKLLEDKKRLNRVYTTCKKLIDNTNNLLKELSDPFLVRIVSVTELRLDSFFKNYLKLEI